MKHSIIRTIILFAIIVILAGCSGSIKTSKIPDARADAAETTNGLRYFLPQRVEVSVYHVTLPSKPPFEDMKHRIDRVGDVLTAVINDPGQLWQVTYQGALFASQSVTLTLNDNGAVKTIGLASQNGSTPVSIGALQGIQKGLETQRDFAKTQQQTRIDELNRQTALIKAKKDLEDALKNQ